MSTMIDADRSIGVALREYRRLNRVKQIVLADQLGVSQGYISRLENDEVTPSPIVARRIEEILTGLSSETIYGQLVKVVRHSPCLACIARGASGSLQLIELSKSFSFEGNPFRDLDRGDVVGNKFGPSVRARIEDVYKSKILEGADVWLEGAWSISSQHLNSYWYSSIVGIRNEIGEHLIYIQLAPICPEQFASWTAENGFNLLAHKVDNGNN
jgi:transcriptional regulator with XRE-family HTH domain